MLKLSFILTLAVLYFGTFEETGAIFWPCESAEDCTAVGSSCDADTKLCACANFNSVFSEDFTQCLTTSLFGDTCVDSVQCNLMPSGANCKAGVCDCADGHTYVRGRCRPLNGLDQTCETDLDCYFGYDRNSVSCQDRVCSCANGYYRRYGNICRRKSMEIGDACVVNTDCDEIGSSVKCVSLKCEETGEGATDTPTETPIEPPTETPIEPPTETPIEPSTETPIEPPTETSTEPPLETTTLTDNFLAYNNNNKKISKVNAKSAKFIRSSTSQDSPALQPPLTNGDYRYAQHFTDTETESESETEPLQRNDSRKSREIAVQTSLEAYELKEFGRNVRHVATATASTSTSSRRTSNFNQSFNKNRRRPTFFRFDDDDIKTYSTLSNTDDDADEKKFGSTCTDNGKSCPGLPHSICSNKICFCRQGYYPNNGKCFAELGEIAESTDECEYDFDEISKTCICQKNYFYERDLRSCRKPIQYHLSCTSNSQCSPFGASYCNPQIPRRCTCEQYAEYDELQQMCAYKQGLGAECETDDGCPVTHSLCSNRICVCKDNFYEKDGACHAGIGAECQADLDCTTENAYCPQPGTSTNSAKESDEQDSKTCQCRRGFVHFKDECLKEAEEIEEVCSENEQCKPLLASCIDRKCSCTDEQHLKNGRCEAKKMLGEACSKATECFVEKDPETVECRNSVCQCQVGYREGEQKTCIRVMPNKKNSSGRPSALKIITFILIGSAFLITSAALKQAYY